MAEKGRREDKNIPRENLEEPACAKGKTKSPCGETYHLYRQYCRKKKEEGPSKKGECREKGKVAKGL